MPSKEPIEPLNAEQRDVVAQWRKNNAGNVPEPVLTVIDQHGVLYTAFQGSRYKERQLLTQLRMAMGFTPSSEKSPSGDPVGATTNRTDKKPRDPKERLLQEVGNHQGLASKFRQWANRHARLAKNKGEELKKYDSVDDVTLPPEEVAELEQENAEYMKRLALGGGQNPAFEKATEPFMRGSSIAVTEESAAAPVTADQLAGRPVLKRLPDDERTRYDFSMNVRRISINVEKVVVPGDDGEPKVICGSVADLGPPDSNLTWSFLSNLMILASQFAMPFNRLEKLLSVPGKTFSSDMLADWFIYIAKRFVPIYLELARQLANSESLSGDDTKHRIVQLIRFEKALKEALAVAEKAGKEIAITYPWEHYATIADATATLKKEGPHDLGTLIGSVLPFVSNRLDGKGVKDELYVSVVTGRAVQLDPRSLIVLFRSHFGSFSNLLNALMQLRDKTNTKLLVQSDMGIVNLITDEQVLEWLDVTYFGCASHARRIFKQYSHEDPAACAHILHLFKMIFFYEKGIDLFGRNAENTLAVRDADSRPVWEQIRGVAKQIARDWSNSTKIGHQARYIDRHFGKLTAYLNEPRILSPGNDFCERMLRPEKLIQGGSMFRFSLTGRFALDVNRSVCQTSIAAGAPLKQYIMYVLKSPDEDIKANPAKYTPLAFAKTLEAVAEKAAAEKATVDTPVAGDSS